MGRNGYNFGILDFWFIMVWLILIKGIVLIFEIMISSNVDNVIIIGKNFLYYL